MSVRILGAALALLCVTACQQEAEPLGQLVLSFGTDMQAAKDIDEIKLAVIRRGEARLNNQEYAVDSVTNNQLPATLNVIRDGDVTTPVTVRAVGLKDKVPRTYRELRVMLPTDRAAHLRMPVQWLCDKQVMASSSDASGAASTCPPDQTCKAGDCVDNMVDVDALPDFDATDVFGGTENPLLGTCFNTVPCMSPGTIVTPDDECTIEKPAGAEGFINVALRTSRDGLCDRGMCFITLDYGSDEGVIDTGSRLQLPPAVCRKLRQGTVRAVYVSTVCETKTAINPACGFLSKVPIDHAIQPDPSRQLTPAVVPSEITTLMLRGGSVCCPLSQGGTGKLFSCVCETPTMARVYEVTPSMGAGGARSVADLMPPMGRTQSFFGATASSNDELYWIAGTELRRTSLLGGAMMEQAYRVNGALFELASPLLDRTGTAYVLASGAAGVDESPVSVVEVDPMGMMRAIPTGGNYTVFQLDQDDRSLYVPVDVDVASGMRTARRSSVVRIDKTTRQVTPWLPERAVTTDAKMYGGYLGVQVDATRLFALFEDTNPDTNTARIEVQRVDLTSPTPMPQTIYTTTVDPRITRFSLLGAVGDMALLTRVDREQSTMANETGSLVAASVIRVAAGVPPRILADYPDDLPRVGMPHDDARIYWVMNSGRIYGLNRTAL